MRIRHLIALWAILISVFELQQISSAEGKFVVALSRKDFAYDTSRHLLYIANGNSVLRYNVLTEEYLDPFVLGGSLVGMDLSPDGSHLAVADSTRSGEEVGFYEVNLVSGQNRRITTARAFQEGGLFSVAYGRDGAVLTSSIFEGSGFVPLRRYDPSTQAYSVVTLIGEEAALSASADNRIIGIAAGNTSPGPLERYDVNEGTLLSRSGHADVLGPHYGLAVNRDGTQLAFVNTAGTLLTDRNLATLTRFGSLNRRQPVGAAYHPQRDLLYLAWSETPFINVYNSRTFQLITSYNFEYTFSVPFFLNTLAYNDAHLEVSDDGHYLFASVDGGVRYLALVPEAENGVALGIVLFTCLSLFRWKRHRRIHGFSPREK